MEIQEILFNDKKKYSTVRVIKQWNSLPSEAGQSPFLEVIKTCLDTALGNVL